MQHIPDGSVNDDPPAIARLPAAASVDGSIGAGVVDANGTGKRGSAIQQRQLS